jgi:TolA-binding protein
MDSAPPVDARRGARPCTCTAPAGRRNNVGGLFNQVQQLQQEVMRLNGVVEQLRPTKSRSCKEQSLERYLDIDRRLAAGGAGGVPLHSGERRRRPAGLLQPAAAGVTAIGGAEVAEQPGEGEAYRSAYALVRGQEFDAGGDRLR